ncbi:DUF3152 domain-containing protein [Streptomyces sp. NPDC002033]|uniref:DUF3152 domain-containing protein n=1 Tax=unclassified Streptomyces TaxID=2593676 RepID=UPI00331B3770
MGRHSRKDPAPARPEPGPPADGGPAAYGGEPYADERYADEPYAGRRYGDGPYGSGPEAPEPHAPEPYEVRPHPGRPAPQGPRPAGPRESAPGPRPGAEPTVVHRGYVPPVRPGARGERPGGHPEQREPGGAWGAAPAPGAGSVYGDWRGAPKATATATAAPPAPEAGFPRVAPAPAPPPGPGPASGVRADALTSTGSHRRVPGPRKPVGPVAPEGPPAGRGKRIRTYTGMAAAAVTTVLAVVVAGQVATEGDSGAAGARAAGDEGADRSLSGQSAAARSDGRPALASPPALPAVPQTYEAQMARQLPIDAKLTGPGLFDTVPGVANAPGQGKRVRYRVDVEQGLGLDAQLFAEAVQRTLNDPRSWAHNGAMTFERVPGGEVDFVITLASPGTTGAWCARSGLDTTVDNVSCDSAATERVMINAFRWAQGSPTYGPDQMLAYRQMLINHEVGHRLGHGHVSCQTPGALAPIMQQQTKSLDIDNIHCLPNPWVYPGS